MRKTIIASALVALVLGGGTATAAQTGLIGSKDLQDNGVRSRDVKNGTIKFRDLRPRVRDAILDKPAKGDDGPSGPMGPMGHAGARGDEGAQGPAGTPGADGTLVRNLSGDFEATNASVASTLDGVQFGLYPDASTGGSVLYTGVNDLTLGQINDLMYSVKFSTSDDSPIAAPYLRVFTEDNGDPGTDDQSVIFDATKCATVTPPEDVFQTYEVTAGDVRYDDNGCDGVPPDQQDWDVVKAAHATEQITGIYVTTGFAGGQDISAILRSLRVNGEEFTFGG